MKKLLTIIPLVILLCFTFSCQQAEEVAEEPGVTPLSDEDIAAIKALGPAVDEAALARDWKTLVAFFTEDVVLMLPNKPSIQGNSAMMEMLESLTITHTEHKIRLIEVDGYGDIAYGRATYKETFSLEGVEEPIGDEGKILGIFRKQADGSWRIAIWIYNTDLPLPE